MRFKELFSRVRSRHREHAHNFVSFIVCRVFALALFAITVPYFVNRVGEHAYGVLSLLLLFFGYLNVLDGGLSYSLHLRLTRMLVRSNRRAISAIRSAIPVFSVIALVSSAVLVSAGPAVSSLLFGVPDYAGEMTLLAGALVCIVASSLMAAVIQAFNRIAVLNYSRFILDLAKGLALLIGAHAEQPVRSAIAVISMGALAKAIVDASLVTRLMNGPDWVRPRIHARDLRVNAHFGLPMAASAVVNIGLAVVDKVFVSREFGPTALAAYSIATDLCSKAYFLVWAVTGTFYTLLIRQTAQKKDPSQLVKISLGAVVLVSVFYYAPLGIFAPELLTAWIGEDIASQAASPVRIWSLAAVSYLAMTVFYNYLQSQRKARQLFVLSCATLVVVLILLSVLPRELGITGVSAVVCFALLLQALSTAWLAGRTAKSAVVTARSG